MSGCRPKSQAPEETLAIFSDIIRWRQAVFGLTGAFCLPPIVGTMIDRKYHSPWGEIRSGVRRVVGWMATTLQLAMAIVAALLGWIWLSSTWDNWRFANHQFGNAVEIERVLGSKRWHWESFGCKYAIIVMSPASADRVDRLGPPILSGATFWPKDDWEQKPVPPEYFDPYSNTVGSSCLRELEKHNADAVRRALMSNTVRRSGVILSERSATSRVAFFDPDSRIAGLIMYGD